MIRRQARTTQADIARARRAVQQTGGNAVVEIAPDGTIRIVPADSIIQETDGHDDQGAINSCFVYVMEDADGAIKIGISTCAFRRHSEMRNENFSKIVLRYAAKCKSRVSAKLVEAYVHKSLVDSRIEGEWFDLPVDKGIAAIVAVAKKLDVEIIDDFRDEDARFANRKKVVL